MIDEPYINILAEKARAKVQTMENGMFNLEFARLIIAVCADVVQTSVDHREPASTYSAKIREHFGIDSGKTFYEKLDDIFP